MKNLSTLFLLLISVSIWAQKPYYPEPKWPEQDTANKFYTVTGERHGVSFFKKHYFKDVQYTPTDKLAFDIYHSPDVMYHWYRKCADQYPVSYTHLDMYKRQLCHKAP